MEGVIAYDGRQIYRRSILREKKRVDTTGVGDVFNSSFAAGLVLYQGDIDRALRLGLKNTAAKVAHLGAQSGLLKLKKA
jgi:sugar/nucleoside kinase (ribokinase family)